VFELLGAITLLVIHSCASVDCHHLFALVSQFGLHTWLVLFSGSFVAVSDLHLH
jgi:hypothetical protein